MKNILGLDLGSGSIGWSVIQEGENNRTILGIGSRIIPLSPDDTTQFTQGKSITKNADRTAFRTQRKGYDRYQLRRYYLTQYLHQSLIRIDKNHITILKKGSSNYRKRSCGKYGPKP